jgi:hypothetical protein
VTFRRLVAALRPRLGCRGKPAEASASETEKVGKSRACHCCFQEMPGFFSVKNDRSGILTPSEVFEATGNSVP